MSIGGRFGYDDDGETPNTQIAIHDYGDAPLIFEVRGLPSGAPERHGRAGERREGPRGRWTSTAARASAM